MEWWSMKNEDNDNQYLLNYSSKFLILERQGTKISGKSMRANNQTS